MYVITYVKRVRENPSEQPQLLNESLYFDRNAAIADAKKFNAISGKFTYTAHELKEVN